MLLQHEAHERPDSDITQELLGSCLYSVKKKEIHRMKEKHVGGNDANDDRQIATLNILSCRVRHIFRVWTMTNEQDVYGTAHYRY